MAKLLADLNETFFPISIDFSPEIVSKFPILIIASGGLSGLEGSSIIRSNIEAYVQNGGTIITFSQPHGYEYSILPGGIEGYGDGGPLFG